MTKAELIEAVAEQANTSKADAERTVGRVLRRRRLAGQEGRQGGVAGLRLVQHHPTRGPYRSQPTDGCTGQRDGIDRFEVQRELRAEGRVEQVAPTHTEDTVATAKKAPARRPAAKKAPAKRATAKKAPARKTAAKKAPAARARPSGLRPRRARPRRLRLGGRPPRRRRPARAQPRRLRPARARPSGLRPGRARPRRLRPSGQPPSGLRPARPRPRRLRLGGRPPRGPRPGRRPPRRPEASGLQHSKRGTTPWGAPAPRLRVRRPRARVRRTGFGAGPALRSPGTMVPCSRSAGTWRPSTRTSTRSSPGSMPRTGTGRRRRPAGRSAIRSAISATSTATAVLAVRDPDVFTRERGGSAGRWSGRVRRAGPGHERARPAGVVARRPPRAPGHARAA